MGEERDAVRKAPGGRRLPLSRRRPLRADADQPEQHDEAEGHAQQPQNDVDHGGSPFLLHRFSYAASRSSGLARCAVTVIGSPEANQPPMTAPINPISSAVMAPRAEFLAAIAASASAVTAEPDAQNGVPARPPYQPPNAALERGGFGAPQAGDGGRHPAADDEGKEGAGDAEDQPGEGDVADLHDPLPDLMGADRDADQPEQERRGDRRQRAGPDGAPMQRPGFAVRGARRDDEIVLLDIDIRSARWHNALHVRWFASQSTG
jgi:hypothetical protein